MRHPAIASVALLLCARFSFCLDVGISFGRSHQRPNVAQLTTRWRMPPPPIRTTPSPTLPHTPIRSTPCPSLPARIEQCQQPAQNEIVNLTATGLRQIGQAFVRSKNVGQVYLDGNAITDVSPMAFDELPRLEVLSLSGNNISVEKMLRFREHPALRRLVINDNACRDSSMILADTLNPLTRLQELILRRNGIAGLAVDLKEFAPRLTLLDVSGNRISSIDFLENAPRTLTELRVDDNRVRSFRRDMSSDVEVLSVSGNSITEVCGTATCTDSSFSLAGMTKLNRLNASRNSIANVTADAFQNAAGLTVLDLSDNRIAFLPSNAFNGLQAMRELRLERNRLSVVPSLCELKRLKSLDLSHNHISEVTVKGLCGLPSLETVRLAGNHILNVDHEAFLALQMLRTLDLSSNAINDLPLDLIANARSLDELSLRNNSILNVDKLFDDGFSRLKELHLEDNPLPFIRAGCMSRVVVHLKRTAVADYEEMHSDEDYA